MHRTRTPILDETTSTRSTGRPRHLAKRWQVARFAMLAQALDGKGYLPVVVGSGHERSLAAAIRAASPGAVDLTGQTDITRLATLARRARLTVGNDTGVCHLAAAVGCPLIVLFSRASDPARVAPRGPVVRILGAPDLTDLAAETVVDAAIHILSNPRPHCGRGGTRREALGG